MTATWSPDPLQGRIWRGDQDTVTGRGRGPERAGRRRFGRGPQVYAIVKESVYFWSDGASSGVFSAEAMMIRRSSTSPVTDAAAAAARFGFLTSAFSYGVIVVFALQILVGSGGASGAGTQKMIISILEHPAGGWVTVGIGLD